VVDNRNIVGMAASKIIDDCQVQSVGDGNLDMVVNQKDLNGGGYFSVTNPTVPATNRVLA
jgi:hypothetical protein